MIDTDYSARQSRTQPLDRQLSFDLRSLKGSVIRTDPPRASSEREIAPSLPMPIALTARSTSFSITKSTRRAGSAGSISAGCDFEDVGAEPLLC